MADLRTRSLGWFLVLGGLLHPSVASGQRVLAAERTAAFLFREARPCLRTAAVISAPSANALRAEIVQAEGLRLDEPLRTLTVRKRFVRTGYDVEVAVGELASGGVRVPLNIYSASGPAREAPLLVYVLGCNENFGDAGVQTLAANAALRGWRVVVVEGYCGNGARGGLPDDRIDYAMLLTGLRPPQVSGLIQEIASVVTYLDAELHLVQRDRIVATGYSYGGQVASRLVALDMRFAGAFVPATSIVEPCELSEQKAGSSAISDTVYFQRGAPLRGTNVPLNWVPALIAPRRIGMVLGRADIATPAQVRDDHERMLRALYGGNEGRTYMFRTDDGAHEYGRSRREALYSFLSGIIENAATSQPVAEQSVRTLSDRDVSTGPLGGASHVDELEAFVKQRAAGGDDDGERRGLSALLLGSDLTPDPYADASLTHGLLRGAGASREQQLVFSSNGLEFPVTRRGWPRSDQLSRKVAVVVASNGAESAISTQQALVDSGFVVYGFDPIGFGANNPGIVARHLLSRSLINARRPLPLWNAIALATFFGEIEPTAETRIVAVGWEASLVAALAAYINPHAIAMVELRGVPAEELRQLRLDERPRDGLFWAGFFEHGSVRGLAQLLIAEQRVQVQVP